MGVVKLQIFINSYYHNIHNIIHKLAYLLADVLITILKKRIFYVLVSIQTNDSAILL